MRSSSNNTPYYRGSLPSGFQFVSARACPARQRTALVLRPAAAGGGRAPYIFATIDGLVHGPDGGLVPPPELPRAQAHASIGAACRALGIPPAPALFDCAGIDPRRALAAPEMVGGYSRDLVDRAEEMAGRGQSGFAADLAILGAFLADFAEDAAAGLISVESTPADLRECRGWWIGLDPLARGELRAAIYGEQWRMIDREAESAESAVRDLCGREIIWSHAEESSRIYLFGGAVLR